MIRSSKITLKNINKNKKNILVNFLTEYRIAVQQSIDFIWSLKLETFNIEKDILNLPKYLDYKQVGYIGTLSARAFCSAFEQSISIVRSAVKKRSQLLFVKDNLIKNNKDFSYIDKQLEKYKLIKPEISNYIPAQLSSKCIDFQFNSNHFDAFVRLKSTGFDHIKLPINFNKTFNSRKKNNWKLLNGILISENEIILCQEIETPVIKTEGIVVGADTGISSVITLSDNQTSFPDTHNHTLTSIQKKLSRKKKGSKSFRRTQEHRKNYINWSINQINFDNIKEIRLEEINTFYGGAKSRFLSHFANRLTCNKLERVAEETGVQIFLQACTYKSQRCSGCGMVRKNNRKGKIYSCDNCKLVIDADLNSSINNEKDLPVITYSFRLQELNKNGFFWKEDGLFDLAGQEISVSKEQNESLVPKKNNI